MHHVLERPAALPARFRPVATSLAARLQRAVGAGIAIVAVSLTTMSPAGAQAQAQPTPLPAPADPAADAGAGGLDIGAGLAEQVKQMALASTGGSEVETPNAPRVEILVGKLDPRLRLAPCQRIEPNLPPGTKLWGKTRVALRCVDGPTKWNVYLPLTVKVFGKGLVATSSLSAGTPLAASDFAEAEIDMAAEPGTLIADGQAIVGRVLYGPMAAGQPLRLPLLKPRKYFEAGDTVTILASGAGFSATVEGQAITVGIEGVPARVKMESGKILSGAPISDHRMDVKL